MTDLARSPHEDPSDPAWRAPLDRSLPFPPAGEVDHPNLKELLFHHLRAEQVVLDVGCGDGPFQYDQFAAKFIAFDSFPPATLAGMKSGLDEFRLGRLESFPLPDASCDAVVLGFVLEHLKEPQAFVREAERVLRPGGWCYIAIPNGRSLEDRLFRLATRVAGSRRGPHVQRFTFESFNGLMKECCSLELVAWHRLRASFLWMDHPRLRALRRPFLRLLSLAAWAGIDPFRDSNYQMLWRKALPGTTLLP